MLPGAEETGTAPSVYLDGKKRTLRKRQYNYSSGLLVIEAEGGKHSLAVIY